MNFSKIAFIALLLCLFATSSSAKTVSLSYITAYDDVTQYAGQYSFSSIVNDTLKQATRKYGAKAYKHILIVLDDDNTLTTMPHFLGGVAWFSWQKSLLDSKNPEQVSHSFSGLLRAQRLIYTLKKINLTDPQIPAVLNHYANLGLHIIVNTTRSPNSADVTEYQLLHNGITPTNKPNTLLFKQTGIKNPATNSANLYKPLICDHGKTRFRQPIAYLNGILYLSGQNKGLGLECLQRKLGDTSSKQRQFTYIIFMDDAAKMLGEMHVTYHKIPGIHLITIHFTKYENRNHLPFNPVQATKLEKQATLKYERIIENRRRNKNQVDKPYPIKQLLK